MRKKPLLMDLEKNVYLEGDKLAIIDRRKLPRDVAPLYCSDCEDVARAIEEMAVQGAGDIAVTAGFGLYLTAVHLERRGAANVLTSLETAASRLRVTRPTGFHLELLLKNILKKVRADSRPAYSGRHKRIKKSESRSKNKNADKSAGYDLAVSKKTQRIQKPELRSKNKSCQP